MQQRIKQCPPSSFLSSWADHRRFPRLRREDPQLVHRLAVVLDRVDLVGVVPINFRNGHILNALQILWMQHMARRISIAGVGLVVVPREDAGEGVAHAHLAVERPRVVPVWAEVAALFGVLYRGRFVVVDSVVEGTCLPILRNARLSKKRTASIASERRVADSHLFIVNLLRQIRGTAQATAILILKIKDHLSCPELLIVALLELLFHTRCLQRLISVDGCGSLSGLRHN